MLVDIFRRYVTAARVGLWHFVGTDGLTDRATDRQATDSPVQTNTATCGHRSHSVLPSTSTDTPTQLFTLGRRNVTLRTRRRRRFTQWPEMSVNSPFENSTSKSEEPLRRPGPVLSGAAAGEPGQDLGFFLKKRKCRRWSCSEEKSSLGPPAAISDEVTAIKIKGCRHRSASQMNSTGCLKAQAPPWADTKWLRL